MLAVAQRPPMTVPEQHAQKRLSLRLIAFTINDAAQVYRRNSAYFAQTGESKNSAYCADNGASLDDPDLFFRRMDRQIRGWLRTGMFWRMCFLACVDAEDTATLIKTVLKNGPSDNLLQALENYGRNCKGRVRYGKR